MPYPPIEHHGIIGNLRTAALVATDATIDWLCLPRFDSPSVFASLLDDRRGGSFGIAPACTGVRCRQVYWPDTNVLVTRFLHADGVAELEDYMPIDAGGADLDDQVVRRVRVVRGRLPLRMHCHPAFDYARATHATHVGPEGVVFEGPNLRLGLTATVPLRHDDTGACAEFILGENQTATFVLRLLPAANEPQHTVHEGEAEDRFRGTIAYWRAWLSQCTYHGRWREVVQRSALALKLLTYQPSGALVAAPTTSLPESPGGVRNWDYRYCWLRDASFTLYALLRIGFTEEASGFMQWLSARWHDTVDANGGPLQIMYGIDGRDRLPEAELIHLDGYGGAKPVRIGNAASAQLQLDIYGELMDSVYLFNKYASPVGYDAWVDLRGLVDWVCANWDQPDDGVWEVRGGRRDFVYSRMMCWVAIDRGLRLADKRSFPADRARWLAVRDHLYDQVLARGWDAQRRAFVQSYGSAALDASTLLMPLVFFMAPNDPRMTSTVDAIRRPVSQGGLSADGLVYRYDPRQAPDGLPGSEGTFNMCSFWLVEAMTRAGRTDPARLEDARLLFEKMLGYANHLGLYAEQTGPSGEALGNFPQALTHLAVISAAFNLDRALGMRR